MEVCKSQSWTLVFCVMQKSSCPFIDHQLTFVKQEMFLRWSEQGFLLLWNENPVATNALETWREKKNK